MQTQAPFPSLSVLIAAALDHLVGSSAVRVRAGDTRPACIEARATALHLAAPFAFEQRAAAAPQQRMSHTAAQPLQWQDRLACAVCARGSAIPRPCRLDAHTGHSRRCRCSQRRRLSTWLAPLPSESVLAIPDRLASEPEPLHRIWLHRLLSSSCRITRMTHTRGGSRFGVRTDWRVLCVPVGRPFHGCAGSMHTQAIPVDVGAHRSGD